MEVSIFINTVHKGHQKTGTGSYGMELVYVKPTKEEETREYFGGLTKTSKNRTALTACIESLSYLTRPCTVNLYIDNRYLTEIMINGYYYKWNYENWTNGSKPVKNPDLWKKIFKSLEIHKVNFFYVEVNEYTTYLKTMIKRVEINYKEDNHV